MKLFFRNVFILLVAATISWAIMLVFSILMTGCNQEFTSNKENYLIKDTIKIDPFTKDFELSWKYKRSWRYA